MDIYSYVGLKNGVSDECGNPFGHHLPHLLLQPYYEFMTY